ncbi:MAG: molybdopterin-dependent oxidoreductase, partial [Deltaproteobacteria bacterium]|nr:molybdopterin-dependent oxidoreductase [Deltaproteobacteria bacterium]
GTFIENVPFVGEDIPLERRLAQGWDGRLYSDLTRLDEGDLLVPNDTFYLRTFYPDLLVPPAPWGISVTGLVETEETITVDALLPLVRDQGTHVLECSGNGRRGGFGLMSAASWAGIDVMTVLDMVRVRPEATRVLIRGFDEHSVPSVGGHSTPGAAWVFTFEELAAAGAFFATEMNDAPLPNDHGAPLRLYVPGWYGCASIKWVTEIILVDDDVAATGQMMEFASRTHQPGVPTLARDFHPALMDQAAMATRVERWEVDGAPLYKVVGVMWGGYEPTSALSFSSGPGDAAAVEVCPAQSQNSLWTLFQHPFRPSAAREFSLRYFIEDARIPTRRLDAGYYARNVTVDAI